MNAEAVDDSASAMRLIPIFFGEHPAAATASAITSSDLSIRISTKTGSDRYLTRRSPLSDRGQTPSS